MTGLMFTIAVGGVLLYKVLKLTLAAAITTTVIAAVGAVMYFGI